MGHKRPKRKEKNKEIKPSGLAWQEMVANRPTGTIKGKK